MAKRKSNKQSNTEQPNINPTDIIDDDSNLLEEDGENFQKGDSRSNIWTLNNYTDEEEEAIKKWKCSYLVYGKEIAPTTGTPHLQGYVEWGTAKKTFEHLKKINPRISWRKRWKKCSAQSAANYCKKGEQPKIEWKNEKEEGKNWGKNAIIFEKGTISNQGKREDLEILKEEILEGKSVEQIVMDDPFTYHEYGRTIEKIEEIKISKNERTTQTKGIWIYGDSGVGKSYTIEKWYKSKGYKKEDIYDVNTEDKGWWQGYHGQPITILQEYRGGLTYKTILEMCDENRFYVQARNKQSRIPFTSETVFITSSMSPEDVYSNLSANDKLHQLHRRFDIILMKGYYKLGQNINYRILTRSTFETRNWVDIDINIHREISTEEANFILNIEKFDDLIEYEKKRGTPFSTSGEIATSGHDNTNGVTNNLVAEIQKPEEPKKTTITNLDEINQVLNTMIPSSKFGHMYRDTEGNEFKKIIGNKWTSNNNKLVLLQE